MKKMIFHIPMQIDINMHSGSQIRPQKMIQAFQNIGYKVELIMGYCKDRNVQIKRIKNNILNGVIYDFVYSESSTMPTALTEKHHLPSCPFLDFSFFRFCKKSGIRIGLFYRDIHWNFEQYKIPFYKQKIANFFYNYDLNQYKKYLDTFYLPSKQMYDYIPFEFDKEIIALPPGVEKKDTVMTKENHKLSFIYVGGLGDLYDLTLFSKTISNMQDINFKLCTRKNEWFKNKEKYSGCNIDVYHKNGNGLAEIYNKCNLSILFVKPTVYWKFVMAVKLFEYISYKKPIIAVKNTAVGNFVEKNNIGWVINYDKDELKKLIVYLQNNPAQISEKIKNIEKIIPQNTWEARAFQVQQDLTK